MIYFYARNIIVLVFIYCISCGVMANVEIEQQKWSFGGFFDFRHQSGELNKLTNGFSLYDGAFQIFGELSETTAIFVDIPVSWAGPQDQDGDGQADEFNNRWALAEQKAQAFVVKTSGNWKWQLGQFDSPLGLEKNDSRDLSFAKQSLLYQDLNPITHVGVKADWKWNSHFEVHGLVANPKSYGSYGDQKQPEYALQMVFRYEEYFLTPSYYSRRDAGKDYELWNLYGGYKHPQVSFLFEVNRLFDPLSREEKLGYWLQVGWKFFELWSLDFRGEVLSILDEKTAEPIDQAVQMSSALKYKLSSHSRLMLDYSHQERRPLIGRNFMGQELILSLQQSF